MKNIQSLSSFNSLTENQMKCTTAGIYMPVGIDTGAGEGCSLDLGFIGDPECLAWDADVNTGGDISYINLRSVNKNPC